MEKEKNYTWMPKENEESVVVVFVVVGANFTKKKNCTKTQHENMATVYARA